MLSLARSSLTCCFLTLQLQFLQLSDVDVIVEKARSHISDIFPQFSILVLLRCDLHELLGFLSIQRNLEVLFLDGNKISGPIPGLFCNVSRESLLLLDLSENSLTGFPQCCSPLPWVNLYWLLLDFNKITGSLLPPPSSSLLIYAVASNQLGGEISPLICKATSLISLDLSSNGLSGRIPRCLGNLGNTLMSLNLSGNNLHGTIPETFPKTCQLLYLYLNDNQLQGEVPRSLPNCPSLEVLDLTSNQINGTFPDWLGDLPQLQGLLLESNRLNGQIEFQSANLFSKLRILDLSGNSFTGPLPQKIFSLPAIISAAADQKNASYVATIVDTSVGTSLGTEADLEFTISITYKGKKTSYDKVLNIFAAIDLLDNRFVRTIPKSIGNLVGLQSLNVSYNSFIGAIPRSIASLLNIEVMYLSHNMLFGEIPQQLAGLTTLEMFNVSYNNLIGKIPQGNQFNTFENDSFAGNTGLCGFPLSALCGGSGAHHSVSTSPSEEEEGNEDSWTLVDWIIISLGYVAGLVIGMIFGRILTRKYHEWSVDTFGRRRREKKRRASLMELFLNLLCMILCMVLSIIISSTSSSSLPRLCHHNERTALLQFKLSFSLSVEASSDPFAYPKTETLDLRSSFLYGFLNSNSTIFNLVHLKILDLSDNNFTYSPIPPALGSLTELKYLNLSSSSFYGVVPTELSKLSKLISLVLHTNIYPPLEASLLKLDEASLVTLVRNLTSLEILGLDLVQILARVPTILANSTRLVSLYLKDCGFYGQFPQSIFMLPNLQLLSLSGNEGLVGSLPEFRNSSNLQVLQLAGTGFSGQIPHSINNLDSLVNLNIRNCSFQGQIPNSLGDLTKLSYIDLSHNNFSGQIPSSFSNLTSLSHLDLGHNQLTGDIPSFLGKLSDLNHLALGSNHLQGSIPTWISQLLKLKVLDLLDNAFTGAVEFDLLFSNLTQLTFLQLSDVDVIVGRAGTHSSDIFPQFSILVLTNCNLHELPGFLSIQRNLEVLHLDGNKISGPIPGWFCNVSKESLLLLHLEQNSLTGFPQGCSPLPWVNLLVLHLNFNNITGPLLPPPSSSLWIYAVESNQLGGEISPLICKATSLYSLDMSSNGLSGKIPPCLRNLGNSLMSLNLGGNNLQGIIPEIFPKKCRLLYLHLSNNQLQGEVPRSISNCSSLEVLDLTSNQLNGTFPYWFGDLPQLQGLLLGSNKLNGQIELQSANLFQKLRILDVSGNSFTGPLSQKIFSLPAIVSAGQKNASYEEIVVFSAVGTTLTLTVHLEFKITITYQGKKTSYGKVLNIFAAVDLSNNRFIGTIPESVGNLVGLQTLNLSYNNFIGAIPRSIASLSNIEVMDLSHNMLSGEIPQQLAGLTMLAMFNVSYNNLTGMIPHGNQFNTFENDSFAGNTGLCGFPLSTLCGVSDAHGSNSPSSSPSEEEGDEDLWTLVDWIIISQGYVAGLVVGMIFGWILTGKYHEWFVETFGRSRRRTKKRRKPVNASP